jgi:UDP-2,4-diacetamido-2,4,6-trideoxy-beta-L-altropyranose hydrolase
MAETTPAVDVRLRNEACEIVKLDVAVGSTADVEQTTRLAGEHGASWIVVDGYAFGAEYQESLKRHGLKVLFIDDNGHALSYPADLVLNQNAHASENLYTNREPATKLLLGPRYAMLRREFTAWRDWKRDIPQVARKVLVTMGGSDPDNVTERVIEAILSQSEMKATVVVGGSNPHLPELRKRITDLRQNLQLVENVTNMPELIANSDLAISGAGTTTWEMCFMGLPAILIVLAGNQRFAAEELDRRGVAINLGAAEQIQCSTLSSHLPRLIDARETRKAMSDRGRTLVDGYGAARVVRALLTNRLQIRRATAADCKLLWDLANDPTVRATAFSSAPILWADHISWFDAKMRDATCHILICEGDGAFLGQARFDERPDGQGEIDVSVAREFRGEGVGGRLIAAAVREIFASSKVSCVHAYILPENIASQKAFETARFQSAGEANVKGRRALHYVRNKSDIDVETTL